MIWETLADGWDRTNENALFNALALKSNRLSLRISRIVCGLHFKLYHHQIYLFNYNNFVDFQSVNRVVVVIAGVSPNVLL